MTAATTSNYFTIAVADDAEAEASLDKTLVRRQRIAAAVERSKTEYRAEHAHTERDSGFPQATIAGPKPKIDRQHLEFLVSSLYSHAEYKQTLQHILDALDENKKSLGGLSRELVDTGIRAALQIDDISQAVRLARLCRDQWRGQYAGFAAVCADAFIAADLYKEALRPLLASISSYGLHEPILIRLRSVLSALNTTGRLDAFLANVDAVKGKTKYSLPRSLFERSLNDSQLDIAVPRMDESNIALVLDLDTPDLAVTLRRLERATGGNDEELQEERGVREL